MSLAVKYRPTNPDQVIGQEAVVRSLRGGKQTWARAYLFVGPSGVGKTTLARIMAHRFAGGKAEASNIIEIDAATNSGADAMRDIAARANYRAVGASPIKTIIIDEVHRISAAAWSSLLKPIEEPPSHVYWILCTTELGKVPKTIQTRCVQYNLQPVDELLIYELLQKVIQKEGLKVDEEILEAVAENSGGSPRQALVDLELCAQASSANEARKLMQTALQQKEPVELARLLISRPPPTWGTITKLISSMGAVEAESVRIVVVNYIAGALLKAKSDAEAKRLMFVLQCFSSEYRVSDKIGPLMLSIGLALGLDQ